VTMVDDDDQDDRRAKDLVAAAGSNEELDPQTQADLARWFGLPSFEQLEETERKAPPAPRGDPEIIARRQAQERATAAVDPAFVAELQARVDSVGQMIAPRPPWRGTLDPSISALDPVLLARANLVTEPREVDMPLGLQNDLKECTPQAVLRDLHRPDIDFILRLEVDPALEATLRIDPVAAVRTAMAARLLPPFVATPFRQALAALEPLAAAKRAPWADLNTPNRRVSE